MGTSPPLLGIVGPTASGKSELALALARRIPVEILVADSRQVVRGMEIGTASPDAAARATVPHHLLDLVEPDEPFTVADWVAAARVLLPEIAARGRIPMLVGGTGLYVAALVDGHVYDAEASSPELRTVLAARLESEGLAVLAAELVATAPELARRLDLRNPRRVLRALERAGSGRRDAPRALPYDGRTLLIGIDRPREELYRRIDARAAGLFAGGLLDEVRGLLARGHGPELRPMSGHGYHEAIRVLAGEWDVDQAIETTARRTRQYAKRQLSWFRRDRRIAWLRAGTRPEDDPSLVAEAERIVRAALA